MSSQIDETEELKPSKKGGKIVNAAEIIQKKFGRDITNANGSKYLKEILAIPTGSVLLDNAIGKMKGYPESAVIEAFGWEGAGKTLMLYLAFAAAQRKFPDKKCVLIDAEKQFKFQAEWAQTVGVNVDELVVLQCSTAEECFDMMHALILGQHEVDSKTNEVIRVIEPGDFSIIGVDSVTQLVSLVDATKGMEESRQRGTQASAIGLGLKKVTAAMARPDVDSKTVLFFINQLRKNPNSNARNKEYRTGGNALPFYDTVAMKVAKVWDSEVRKGDEIISHDVAITFKKNKAGSLPEDAIVFTLKHDGSGVDNEKELFDVALMNGVLKEFELEHKGKMVTRYNFVDPETDELIDENIKYFAMKKKFHEIVDSRPDIRELIDKFIDDGKIFTNKDEIEEELPDDVRDDVKNSEAEEVEEEKQEEPADVQEPEVAEDVNEDINEDVTEEASEKPEKNGKATERKKRKKKIGKLGKLKKKK